MDVSNYRIFSGLNKTQLDNFMAACTEESIPAGRELITFGSKGTRVFFLMEGELLVFLPGKQRVDLATLTAPAVAGEMELLTGLPRSASVAAATDAKVLGIPYTNIRRRIEDGDTATLKVMHNIAIVLALRLSATVAKWVELEKHPPARPEELRAFREKLFSDWSF